MQKPGIGAAEALQIWLRHQVVTPVVSEETDLQPDLEEEGRKMHVFWNDKDVIMFFEPGAG
jgi:hypothetical protein